MSSLNFWKTSFFSPMLHINKHLVDQTLVVKILHPYYLSLFTIEFAVA